jgi:hypothetical protein
MRQEGRTQVQHTYILTRYIHRAWVNEIEHPHLGTLQYAGCFDLIICRFQYAVGGIVSRVPRSAMLQRNITNVTQHNA